MTEWVQSGIQDSGEQAPRRSWGTADVPGEGLQPEGPGFRVGSLRPLGALNPLGVEAGEAEARAESLSAFLSQTVRFFFFFRREST